MPPPACPTSGASRLQSGILTPSSDGSVTKSPDHDTEKPAARQAAPSLPMEELLEPTIVVKPHPSHLHVKPHVLQPLMILPREHLPLSGLDLSMPHGDLSASRFYESSIKILDLEGRLGSNLLLARSETSRMLYAVERQGNGLYVLCKLGAWVDVWKLAQLATVACRRRIPPRRTASGSAAAATQPPLTTPQLHKENKKRRLAIEEIQSMVKKRPRSRSVTLSASQDCEPLNAPPPSETGSTNPAAAESPDLPFMPPPTPPVTLPGPEPEPADTPSSQPTAGDIFQTIRGQYMESLYHSMGSLAYFAKGPLSRARAAFRLDCDSNLDMNDLIGFLKSLVLTTAVVDKKYRETVPEITAQMKLFLDDSDGGGGTNQKKRKSKKIKIGKGGLYPEEEAHVRRWWKANKPTAPPGADEKLVTPEELKYHVSCLRRRETQLQMIVILEILALELLRRPADEESQLPGMETQPAAVPDAGAGAPAKKKNKNDRHDLPLLLDVHADRLCIWQSTTSDEMKALAESQVSSHAQQAESADRPNSDPLKDFCVDIILPFFSARLPELCDSINRKLGGPVIKSPTRAERSRPAGRSGSKPGAPARKTPALRKDRERTLERVLSTERMRRSVSRGPTDAIKLMRSASATTIPGLKREPSEHSLVGGIPTKKPDGLARATRPATSHGGGTEDDRAKKKAVLDAELKDAISALKKPNRALAGKEIVEAAEKRTTTSLSQLKKARKPTRMSSAAATVPPAVQVKATPANNRFRDAIAGGGGSRVPGLSLPDGDHDDVGDDADATIPSSSFLVPSSAAPKRTTTAAGGAESLFLQSPAVAATPVPGAKARTAASGTLAPLGRTPIRLAQVPEQQSPGSIFQSSPVLARRAATTNTSNPDKSRADNTAPLFRLPTTTALFETPVRSRPGGGETTLDNETPIKPLRLSRGGKNRQAGGTASVAPSTAAGGATKKQMTIYQQLGWDDDEL